MTASVIDMLRSLSFQVNSIPMGPGGLRKASVKINKNNKKCRKRKKNEKETRT